MSSGLYSGVSGLALGTGLYRNVSGLWSGASGLIAGFDGGNPYGGASLYLDFLKMTAPSFDTRITFTRGSNATLVDSTGKLTYAPNNLLLYSEQFGATYWAKLGSTIAENTSMAPDGTMTADKLQEDATTARHYVTRHTADFVAGTTYTLSFYVKAAERQWVCIGFKNESNKVAWFNLATGVVGTVQASISAASITPAGNGWYRCSITAVATSTLPYPSAAIANADGADSYAGTAGSGLFVWGAQLEAVTYQTTPSTYQATTSTAYYGPRFDYDPVTLAAKGLLIEEQRANLVTYSAQFDNAAWGKSEVSVTANATTAPDGTLTADKLIESTANSLHTLIVGVTTTAIPYTWSCYIKAAERTFAFLYHLENNAAVSINLLTGATGTPSGVVAPTATTVTDMGNGWYRLAMTVTATAASNSFRVYVTTSLAGSPVYTGDGTSGIYIWGAQLEAGAFATSYIPTVASTVTRSADVATMTGANFSSWWNASAGTFVAAADTFGGPVTRVIVGSTTGSFANYVRSTYQGAIFDGTYVANSANTVTSSVAFKLATAYDGLGLAASLDGGTAGTNLTTGSISAYTSLALGSGSSANYLNGHIRSIAYYNTRLPNAQLQSLTT